MILRLYEKEVNEKKNVGVTDTPRFYIKKWKIPKKKDVRNVLGVRINNVAVKGGI